MNLDKPIKNFGLRKPRKPTHNYQLRIFYEDGSEGYETLRTNSKQIAEKILNKYKTDFALMKAGLKLKPSKNSDKRLKQFSEEIINYYNEINRSEKTLSGDAQALDKLIDHFGDVKLSEITTQKLEYWRQKLLRTDTKNKRPFTIGSVNNYFRHLKSAFNHGLNNGLVDWNPFDKVKLLIDKDAKAKIRFLSQNEIEKVREHIIEKEKPSWHLALFNFELWTGARGGEVINLKLTDVFLDSDYLVLTGKGNKRRNIPISNNVRKILGPRIDQIETLNPDLIKVSHINSKAREIARRRLEDRFIFWEVSLVTTINHIFKKYFDALGIDASQHSLRHSFATRYLDKSGREEDLQEWLGHSTRDMTKIYGKIRLERLKENVDQLTNF